MQLPLYLMEVLTGLPPQLNVPEFYAAIFPHFQGEIFQNLIEVLLNPCKGPQNPPASFSSISRDFEKGNI